MTDGEQNNETNVNNTGKASTPDGTRSGFTYLVTVISGTLIPILMLLFLLACSYQIIQLQEFRTLLHSVEKAEARIKAIEALSARFHVGTANALRHIIIAYRETGRSDFGRALKNARIAESHLTGCGEWVDAHVDTFVETDSRNDLAYVTSLRRAIEIYQASSLTIQARCQYFLQNYEDVKALAQRIEDLDKKDWNAYHYRGIAAMEQFRETGDEKYARDAVENLQKSVQERSEYNPDFFNLQELHLVAGKYDLVILYGNKYLVDYENHRRLTQRGRAARGLCAVADGYIRIARAILGNPNAVYKVQEYVGILKEANFDLRNTFASTFARKLRQQLRDTWGDMQDCETEQCEGKKAVLELVGLIITMSP